MNNFEFLPEDYTSPKLSNYYTKLQDGENKIRILSKPVIGWEDWTLEKKPLRYRLHDKPAKSIDPKKPIKHFWACLVWNYTEEQIQIFHITQAMIRSSIEVLSKDTDWGAPYFYDLKIIKSGEAMKTSYAVNPLPHKPLNIDIIEKFNERHCNLEAIFDNEDPFASHWKTYTKGIFTTDEAKESTVKSNKVEKFPHNVISKKEADDLLLVMSKCPEEFQENFDKFLVKNKINSSYELPTATYEKIKLSADLKMREHKDELANAKKKLEGQMNSLTDTFTNKKG